MSQVWESAKLMVVTGKRGKTRSKTKIAVDYTLRCGPIGRNGVNSWLPFIESNMVQKIQGIEQSSSEIQNVK